MNNLLPLREQISFNDILFQLYSWHLNITEGYLFIDNPSMGNKQQNQT